MSRPRRLLMAALRLAALSLTALASLHAPPALADHTQLSVFQDDDHLVYSDPATVQSTLATLRSLGVQVVRVTMKWSALAPAPTSTVKPSGFDATNPAAYPSAAWARYDLLTQLAAQYGITVQFNLTAPGPLWAMAPNPPIAKAADHYAPSPAEFGSFVQAVARRYSGTYDGLPRVSSWSIWNEPNEPGWLAPQWVPSEGGELRASPRLYRAYVQAAYLGLRASGHQPGTDTILIGELAPEGSLAPGSYLAMPPMPFLRSLYCVDDHYRRLRGRIAAAAGCPTQGSAQSFVAANPLLFDATGFGHHPYDFFRAPGTKLPDADFVPLADLTRLESGLDRVFKRYGVRRRIPIYLTEYGYQTNPPDPYELVSPAQQAVYLNHADYIAWRDPRVKTVSQFLLFDAPPDSAYAPSDFDYWDTFQTGLEYSDGVPKPAFAAYRMPIWIPTRRLARGKQLVVWGQLRAATPHTQPARAQIQWQPTAGPFRTIKTIITRNPSGYFETRVRFPGTGAIRIVWSGPNGELLASRSVAVWLR